jgi:hypothetical protein
MLLLQQYEIIAAEILAYQDFRRWIMKRVATPYRFVEGTLYIVRSLRNLGDRIDKGHWWRNDQLQGQLRQALRPPEHESRFASILLADYPIHALSLHLEERYSTFNFAKLPELGTMLGLTDALPRVAKVGGALVLGATILLQLVPHPAVEALQINYAIYQRTAFWLTAGFSVHVLLSLIPASLLLIRWKRKHEEVQTILVYTKLRREDGKTEAANTHPAPDC